MKKTFTITLANTLFHVEEDAYEALNAYLSSIKTHFASSPEQEEIINDIESRMAEQFLENNVKIVKAADVEKIIHSMGRVEEFEGSEDVADREPAKISGNSQRKLYRDGSNKIIAGVSSGLAAFFGVDPILVRIIFALSLLLGGAGILVYIVLWLLVPEAKTASENLQMRGETVTLESVNQFVKERVEEVKKNRGFFSKLIRFPFKVLGWAVPLFVRYLAPFIATALGVLIIAVACIALVSLTFVLFLILTNIQSPYVDFPFMEVVGKTVSFYVLLIAGYLVALVPLLFGIFLGLSLAKRRSVFKSAIGFALLGVWFISLIAAGVVGVNLAQRYQMNVANSSLAQNLSKSFDLSDFSKLEVSNGNRVTITQGLTYHVTAQGSQKALDMLRIEKEGRTLKVSTMNRSRICIFCRSYRADIQITTPRLEDISAQNSSEVIASDLTVENLMLNFSNSSRAFLNLHASSAVITLANSAWLELTGETRSANVTMGNSSLLQARRFAAQEVILESSNSSTAEVSASSSLIVSAGNSSSVMYSGEPAIQQQLENSAKLCPAPAPSIVIPSTSTIQFQQSSEPRREVPRRCLHGHLDESKF